MELQLKQQYMNHFASNPVMWMKNFSLQDIKNSINLVMNDSKWDDLNLFSLQLMPHILKKINNGNYKYIMSEIKEMVTKTIKED